VISSLLGGVAVERIGPKPADARPAPGIRLTKPTTQPSPSENDETTNRRSLREISPVRALPGATPELLL
jgi:hypothetical protein